MPLYDIFCKQSGNKPFLLSGDEYKIIKTDKRQLFCNGLDPKKTIKIKQVVFYENIKLSERRKLSYDGIVISKCRTDSVMVIKLDINNPVL